MVARTAPEPSVRVRLSLDPNARLARIERYDPNTLDIWAQDLIPLAEVGERVDEVTIDGAVPQDPLRRAIVARAASVIASALGEDEVRRLWATSPARMIELRGCEIPSDLPPRRMSLTIWNCRGFGAVERLARGSLTLHLPYDDALPETAYESVGQLFLWGSSHGELASSPVGRFDLGTLARMQRLRGIALHRISLNPYEFAAVMSAPVESVDLHTVGAYWGEEEPVLAEASRLTCLRVHHTNLEEATYRQILMRSPNLESLAFPTATLSADLLRAIARHGALKTLDIDGVQTISGTVAAPNVKRIDVASNAPRLRPRLRRAFPNAEILVTGVGF